MAPEKTPMNKGKGLESSSSSEPPLPHFFDIPAHPLSQGIRIPALFMRRHGKSLDKKAVVLRVPGGPDWKVELTVVNGGETWMQKGLHEFGEYYYIRKFNLLVFKLEGNSRFLVTIFDVSSAEIDYSFRTRMESVYTDGAGSSTAAPESPVASPELSGREKFLECQRNFQSEFPFFASLLKPTSVYPPYTMYIPKGFMRANFGNKVLKEKGWLSLYLRVAGDKTNWPVLVYKPRTGMYGRFGNTTWKQIVQEHGMTEGEVCIFEFVKSENVFNIYRFP